jgi:hypothetical protein
MRRRSAGGPVGWSERASGLLMPSAQFFPCRCCGGDAICMTCSSQASTMQPEVTFAGVTNGSCAACVNWNDTFVCDFLGTNVHPSGGAHHGITPGHTCKHCWWGHQIVFADRFCPLGIGGVGHGINVWIAYDVQDDLTYVTVYFDYRWTPPDFTIGYFRQSFSGYKSCNDLQTIHFPAITANADTKCNWSAATCDLVLF